MAALGQASSRSMPPEGAGGSVDLSVTTRSPVPAVSPERPVSPGQVAEPPGKNLWEQICEAEQLSKPEKMTSTSSEYEAELPPFPEEYKVKQEPSVPVLVTPLEEFVPHGFNTEHYLPTSHFSMMSPIPCPQMKSETIKPKTCSPRDYLETFIFPVLLPGMANLLHQAKREKCFEDQKFSMKAAADSVPRAVASAWSCLRRLFRDLTSRKLGFFCCGKNFRKSYNKQSWSLSWKGFNLDLNTGIKKVGERQERTVSSLCPQCHNNSYWWDLGSL
ncbi:IQ domain-containing protein K isoform X5 [Nannospalax galili]|uniref:IQ domain-containing protein K isoform X5 n=1 Tax=Nannospalax galili TaxID=1026970 RepID=UPI00111C3F05|nr:IQ domain-containing protein K isoform X5 [Nannospalax galili]